MCGCGGAFCFVVFKEPDFIECVFRLAQERVCNFIPFSVLVVYKWRWEFNFVDGRRRRQLVFWCQQCGEDAHKSILYVCRHASWWRGEIIFIIFECCSRPTQNAALNKAHFPLILHIHRLAQWSVQFATLECLKEQIESCNKKLALGKILRPQLSFPLVTLFQTGLFLRDLALLVAHSVSCCPLSFWRDTLLILAQDVWEFLCFSVWMDTLLAECDKNISAQRMSYAAVNSTCLNKMCIDRSN